MTQEISFISAGEDEKEAISFLLKFVEEKFLELASTPENKINLRCNDASQASEIYQNLWVDLNDIFLAHKISNDAEMPSCPVEISYPGIKVNREFDLLLNLNPQLPSNYLDFSKVFQIVIKDGSEFQNKARLSYKKCLEDKINPNFID